MTYTKKSIELFNSIPNMQRKQIVMLQRRYELLDKYVTLIKKNLTCKLQDIYNNDIGIYISIGRININLNSSPYIITVTDVNNQNIKYQIKLSAVDMLNNGTNINNPLSDCLKKYDILDTASILLLNQLLLSEKQQEELY